VTQLTTGAATRWLRLETNNEHWQHLVTAFEIGWEVPVASNFTVLVERVAKWLCAASAVAVLAACGGGDPEDAAPSADEAQPATAEGSRATAEGVTILNRSALRPATTTTPGL
jgi:hypothetical protein